jgi:hypothetical protein
LRHHLDRAIAFFADHPVTGQAEQARRQREIDFARGSVRLEGGHLTDEIERLNAGYVAGEIDSDGVTTAILGVRDCPIMAWPGGLNVR